MKKFTTFFIITILALCSLHAQECLPDGIWFKNQHEVDNFSNNYPNCTKVLGNVGFHHDVHNLNSLSQIIEIGGNLSLNIDKLDAPLDLPNLKKIGGDFHIDATREITDFNSLNSVDSIGGSLFIRYNLNLKNILGLKNLKYIGENFIAIENHEILNFEGLNNLKKVEEKFEIKTCYKLKKIQSFNSLNSVGFSFQIKENDSLKAVTGFTNFESTKYFYLRNNPILSSIQGFSNFNEIKNCLEIDGNYNLESLSPFKNIKNIPEDLSITGCRKIQDLSVFKNLEELGKLTITGNDLLKKISGFNKIKSLRRGLSIGWNPKLTSLEGFKKLNYIGEYLAINNNDILQDLEGFDSLQTLHAGIGIAQNRSLKNIHGLRNVKRLINGSSVWVQDNPELLSLRGMVNMLLEGVLDIRIRGNSKLQICSEANICHYFLNGKNGIIENNGSGCNSLDEIISSCPGVEGKINAKCYYDINRDGKFDFFDEILPDCTFKLDPGELINYSSSEGTTYYTGFGNFKVSYLPNPNWEITSGSNFFETKIDSINQEAEFRIGLYPKTKISKITNLINFPPARCNNFIDFTLTSKNIGTSILSGTIWLEIDPNISETMFLDPPDSITNTNKVGWHFNSLYPGHQASRKISLKIPGPLDFSVGDRLYFKMQTQIKDSTGNQSSEEFIYIAESRCSYDPNDKLVNPNRTGNYTLFDEHLTYTVRFQNTGNDYAYKVEIKDTLDQNLDPTTFKILNSSHYELLNTTIEDERYLTFEFKNIFLPDSTTNFDQSQGYVSYMIQAKGGLAENTPINNTASIYFDFNPPVVTNTTESIMVSELPTVSTKHIDNQPIVNVYPNPSTGKITLSGKNLTGARVTVFDPTGRILKIETLNSERELTLPGTREGMFFLKIETDAGTVVKRVMKN